MRSKNCQVFDLWFVVIGNEIYTDAVIPRCSTKQTFLKILKNLLENTCAGVIFNKFASLKVCNFIKKRLYHRCFPVNFAKFLTTPFFTEPLRTTASYQMVAKQLNRLRDSNKEGNMLELQILKMERMGGKIQQKETLLLQVK